MTGDLGRDVSQALPHLPVRDVLGDPGRGRDGHERIQVGGLVEILRGEGYVTVELLQDLAPGPGVCDE